MFFASSSALIIHAHSMMMYTIMKERKSMMISDTGTVQLFKILFAYMDDILI